MKGKTFLKKVLPQQRGAVLELCYLRAMHTIIEQVLRPELVGVVKSLPEVLACHRVHSQQGNTLKVLDRLPNSLALR